MVNNKKSFASQLRSGDFVVTAEYLPKAETEGAAIKTALQALKEVPSAVNVADNPFGIVMSSLAAAVILAQSGIEPVYQVVTRDRNRIAIQSDLLGAAALGIRNVLCLSGYHQTLTDNPESANVYDLDSTQLLHIIKKMREQGELLNGEKINGAFPVMTGAVANPYLKPVDLSIIRLTQKVEAGAEFIQTHAVFNIDEFQNWFDAVKQTGLADKTAIIAGVFPLDSAEEAEFLLNKYTEFQIPAVIIERLKAAGDREAQKKEGLAICVEIINKLKNINGLRGIHILSGGKEETLPDILSASGLSGKR
ncbi:MAG: methylenetetrahydrofolate reductase [Syntrophales bacterium]|jgi:methylenetetrahydrofolate reductase (NADPH)|nr:methylenetetrahydrofolate reductase [Syntrophales bacterium]MCK9391527.1 methylenetetrahydrofolate reductase [Syntrophales bacterium]